MQKHTVGGVVLLAALLVSGCNATTSGEPAAAAPEPPAAVVSKAAMVPSTIGKMATPPPPEGTKYHNYCILRVEPVSKFTSGRYEGYWKDMRAAGYVVDLPGFPLPLFSDPERRDATTAHLTVCSSSSVVPDSMSGQWDNGNGDLQHRGEFTATFYYDPTPEGDFTDLSSFCGTSEDAIELGGDVTIEPWMYSEAPPTEISTTAETLVDRSVPLTGPNGEVVLTPSPEGTRWHVKNNDHADAFIEVWVYDYLQ